MENCLVTKLKGTVNNDSLPILGAGIFEVTKKSDGGYNDYYFRIYANQVEESFIHADGGTFEIVGSANKHLTDYKVLAESERWADNAVYPDSESWEKIKYTVSNIYNIYSLDLGREVKIVSGISSILDYGTIVNVTVRQSLDIGSCKCGTLQKISVPAGCNITGNWHDIIANNPSLEAISVWDNRVELPNNAITSSIEVFAGFMGDLAGLPTTVTSLKADMFTGSLNDYVTRLRAADRTSGSIELALAQNSQMTLDGVSVTAWCNNHGVTPANYLYLVWTSDNIALTGTNPNP